MDAKKSNKIREIVRLQQILKKWRKLANASSNHTRNNNNNISSSNSSNNSSNSNNSNCGGTNKGIKFLKKTLSFSDNSVSSVSTPDYVPKGYLAIHVGKELKRYVIPTDYLGHQAFGILLREAEEEFGFQQEGVLKIPCDVALFDKILKMVEQKRDDGLLFHDNHFDCYQQFHGNDIDVISASLSGCCSPDVSDQLLHPYPQLCR
ncbi:uncharacterized protein LOC141613891 [Silene latifolia]|uniref:uncharacterized protein LOC141613891 n=1 Tax=Silene latifolia TaxID=37657 RepID=UPI003D772E3A